MIENINQQSGIFLIKPLILNTMKNNKWNFDNSYLRLPEFFYTRQNPIPVRTPETVIFNESLANELGTPYQPEVYAGNLVPGNTQPIAQAYAGHQFGYFTMLGDGRAILLGEQINKDGERFDIQLKGSGKTPYSRDGDGRAALKPMLREYIISEAMYKLGIPTTRSLAVMLTGETVIREKLLPGAILTRTASSHIRVGTFEYASRFGTESDVCKLADYTITRHFPNLENHEDKYLHFLKEVINRQAFLISKWQSVGFIHGVMNTDNMSICGETIDYGPCAFMDVYDPATVFSSIDTYGRYAYGNQPKIAAWNLARFAETLLPFLNNDENKAIKIATDEIEKFHELYQNYYYTEMSSKLGIGDNEPNKPSNVIGANISICDLSNRKLIDEWLEEIRENKSDFTNSFPNPVIIPRNHKVEEALETAEKGDLILVERLLNALGGSYNEEFGNPAEHTGISCQYRTFCGT